jgi:hypothetical protein
MYLSSYVNIVNSTLTALIVYNKFLFIFAVAGGFVYCSAFYSELINAQTSL